jgi:uncharacterized membrane protein YdjX (TVP38/TMEM64 family)
MRHRSLLLTLIAVVIIGSLGALWAGGWLDFATIKAHHNQLAALVRDWPLLSALGFFLGFVLATALSIPIATALSLLAGSLFGLMEALLLVSFASTTGATLAMLLARYVLRDIVEKRWPRLIARTNRGLKQDGLFYLLALRLAPAPPFFVVNLLMGMTRMPAGRFFVISQIGLLPIDIVFVNAGRALATLDSPADALSTDVMLALALASVLPLLLRRLIRPLLRTRID